jgi:hypothetical protein
MNDMTLGDSLLAVALPAMAVLLIEIFKQTWQEGKAEERLTQKLHQALARNPSLYQQLTELACSREEDAESVRKFEHAQEAAHTFLELIQDELEHMDEKDRERINNAIYGAPLPPKQANYVDLLPNYRYLFKLLRESVSVR